ncbi:MAG: Flp pilus assembly protein CpaB, partial [Selenomonadaceae bacterium]|nr:Flp pilus assembly protein CpaB [Selenomonadaceae bacterium]
MFKRLIDKFNNMQPRQLLILAGVAAFLMFAALFLGVNMMTKQEVVIQTEQPAPPAIETVSVVVAKTNIQPRTRIQESMLQMKDLPVNMVPEGAIKSFDDVKNVQIKVSIFAGDVLTIQKVFAEASDEGFAGSIPANCRAISINVNDVTGVAGFAKPGDRVDLLLVEKGQHSATTNLLLQNVPILSINQDSTGSAPVGENGVPTQVAVNPTIATFALPPEDALKLISASKLGEIYLSLRPAKPQATYVEPMEYTIESVNAPRSTPAPAPVIPSTAPPAQIPAAPSTPKIEIIAGDQIVQGSTPAPAPVVSGA